MIIIMNAGASKKQIEAVTLKVKMLGLDMNLDKGISSTLIGIRGDTSHISSDEFMMEGVKEVKRVTKQYKEVSMEFKQNKTCITVGGATIGGGKPVIMAGPCAVENEDDVLNTAKGVKEAGAHILRGGAFKPRTSPYAFQGLREDGLKILAYVKKEVGIPIISEAMAIEHIELFEKYDIDIIQVGARNMQNFDFLKELGKAGRPVVLKRGHSSTVEEFLLSAEYILTNGLKDVVLCERGIRTFETSYRNVMDLNCIALIKTLSHLPIIADPSHGTGVRELVAPLSMASLAAGADGLLIEAHIDPYRARCDAKQQLNIDQLKHLMKEIGYFTNR